MQCGGSHISNAKAHPKLQSQCVSHDASYRMAFNRYVTKVLCFTSASGCIVFCLNSKVDALLALYDNYQFSPRLFLPMYIKLVKRSQLQCKCVTTTYKSMKLFFLKFFFVQSDKIIPHFMGNCTASLVDTHIWREMRLTVDNTQLLLSRMDRCGVVDRIISAQRNKCIACLRLDLVL